MGRSQETRNKKEVRFRKDKKKKDKEIKRLGRKESNRDGNSLDDMIAYVDEFGNITSTPPDLSQRAKINLEDIEISVPKNRIPDATETIRKGIVSFFNDAKGYGFIKDLSTQESIFVHAKGLMETITENNKVTFEVEMGPKGLNAFNVKIDR
jgi:cold shock CspA family protein